MAPKRKRDILEGFDPNKSDPEDNTFDPLHDVASERTSRSKKKARKEGRTPGRRRAEKYGGEDIDDDDDDMEMSESDGVTSFHGEDEPEDDENSDDAPMASTGRRMRKAAVALKSYKESSDDESEGLESAAGDSSGKRKTSKEKPSRIVVLNVKARLRRGSKAEPISATRRTTRAQSANAENHVELSESGKHVRITRSSKSRSPDTVGRPLRSTRASKGLRQTPAPIEEGSQETEPKEEVITLDAPNQLGEDVQADEPGQDGHADEPDEDAQADPDTRPGEGADANFDEETIPESSNVDGKEQEAQARKDGVAGEDEDDSEAPVRTRNTRATRASKTVRAPEDEQEDEPAQVDAAPKRILRRGTRNSGKKSAQEPSSDFEPGDETGEGEGSERGVGRARNMDDDVEDTSGEATPRPGRPSRKSTRGRRTRKQDSGDEEVELDKDEMAMEAQELRDESSRPSSHPRRERRRKRSPMIQYERSTRNRRDVNYTIPAFAPDLEEEVVQDPAATPARGRRNGKSSGNAAWVRPLNTTYGPFGGGGGAGSLLGGPWGTGAAGGVDSDSSDDEMAQRPGIGGAVGLTPSFPGVGPTPNAADGLGGTGGAALNVGKIKNQKALADADPLGVDLTVDFSKVGGLQQHIDQLKEMVQLPLLYPELFQKLAITPPRGVLFHGPPGTGKTLLARALANSVGMGGQKVTFYMRKGADALSKWVGEAEKQLRLLFEEARRTQPSIIFFDEIDGLAPVRSSKQEQIHASIVSTLLALMDGMDGRGQVIVIGATNRPDNIDPALRRPGRFDREFYFPLPDVDGRRSILNIHTKDWGLSQGFLQHLAQNTKGYGGADLRALCTEAALNAIQRTYPQIYSSKEKLVVNPDKVSVHATDFTISMKKMVPSSERSASSSAAPLPRSIEPLLRTQFSVLLKLLDDVFPRKKKITALEEAMFEVSDDLDHGFGREALQQEFDRTRIFRPRLLINGLPGMGQNYLSSAVLHYLEGVHVQNFDLATLLGDGRPLEQVIVSAFAEVKRRKPSVLLMPDIDAWWQSVPEAAITTFRTMMKTLPPTDPVLLLATAESSPSSALPADLLQSLFSFSKRNRTIVGRPSKENRSEFFRAAIEALRRSPKDFPDGANRKKRILEVLPVAPPPPPRVPTRAEIKTQRKADLLALNQLKMRLQPIMDQINRKYRKFRNPVIPFNTLNYLFDEADPNFVRPDLAEGTEQRPYELAKDHDGNEGIKATETGTFFYNLETNTIEERLANGYYARPIDFFQDINRLYLDAKNIGDRERMLKALELRTNVEVDISEIEQILASWRLEEVYQRQVQRAKDAEVKARHREAMRAAVDLAQNMVQSDVVDNSDSQQGPVTLGLGAHMTTAARFAVMSPMSNGHGQLGGSAMTNGTSLRPSGEDAQMSGMDDDDDDAQPMGPPPPASNRPVSQFSQPSMVRPVPPGVSPSAMFNDGSTTRSSELSTNRNSRFSNGTHGSNDASHVPEVPDTQSQPGSSANPRQSNGPSRSASSEPGWAHSQAQAVAQGILPGSAVAINTHSLTNSSAASGRKKASSANVTSLNNILNEEDASPLPHAHVTHEPSNGNSNKQVPLGSDPSQQYMISEEEVEELHRDLADNTSGCSIEQLEQINRELMEELWRTRHEWNRTKVTLALSRVFNDTILDMQQFQGALRLSQATNEDDPHSVVLC